MLVSVFCYVYDHEESLDAFFNTCLFQEGGDVVLAYMVSGKSKLSIFRDVSASGRH